MEKKKNNIEIEQQLKINFDVVEKVSLKCVYETKVISLNSLRASSNINSVIRQKIFREIIDNSKSHWNFFTNAKKYFFICKL